MLGVNGVKRPNDHLSSAWCWRSQIKIVESYNPVAKYRLSGAHEMDLTQVFLFSNRPRTEAEAVFHTTISFEGVVYSLPYIPMM